MRKHAEYLGLEYREWRSTSAAQLHAVASCDRWDKVKDGDKRKYKVGRETAQEQVWIRVHKKARLNLFRPSAVCRRVEVGKTRVTEGTYLHSGHSFKLVDEWRPSQTTALAELWIGKTYFLDKSEQL